ncbi:MAG: hypothetical protein GTO51_09645 [Candidatus Latescibacteria bacterium]|nr:hypothetical protein [Candidatus Latescibacterota bacterium]NIM22192.1 hypothetical protein [Candidatus Latescibacterota bacterium]NIM66231.1 hypothetical protein [Candidatus Latescibacterota bacterium]NIO02307.1 hypothetical protein [Candidatus Latescibacterota bacterium]NIO29838.1 hypothetical protein [Candidatus Latescibacterota bacterium]
MSRIRKAATIWTAFLSVIFAVLLFPSILDVHGFWKSLFFTSLGVLVIWVLYLVIGSLIGWAVAEELKKGQGGEKNNEHNELPGI